MTSSPRLDGHATVTPGWRWRTRYDMLLHADRSIFAWEWLRRTPAYRRAWRERSSSPGAPQAFGLVRLEDPALGAPDARPLWSAALDPSVLQAEVHSLRAAPVDRIDLLDLNHLLTLYVDDREIEHLLFSDGLRTLRIDVVEGTLIGCPAVLRYLVEGIERLRGPLASIDRLVRLSKCGDLLPAHARPGRLPMRWIAELRVADALADGADAQNIARVLYGHLVPTEQWRVTDSAYRTRVQRLIRIARRRLAAMPDPSWFALD